jgi:1-acyl-sn-glycerol-3-phosphate acyltransferase
MFYKVLQFLVRFCLQIFCSKITILNKSLLNTKGPVLIVANHPNSFLDAIIIAAFFKQKVYSLARGDAFKNPWQRLLLKPFNMIPIYRISEGKDNLQKNYNTFKQCENILANNGILLIFIEGVCKNTHQLLPFKKGAARIVEVCLQQNIALQIMPIALGYSSFNKIPLSVTVNLQRSFNLSDFKKTDMALHKILNLLCHESLNAAITIPTQHHFGLIKTTIYLIGFPFFKLLNNFVLAKTRSTVFYHSILFASCFLLFVMMSAVLLLFFALKLIF